MNGSEWGRSLELSMNAALQNQLQQRVALLNAYRPPTEAARRKAKNRQRVADHFDRLNAQGIALGGK